MRLAVISGTWAECLVLFSILFLFSCDSRSHALDYLTYYFCGYSDINLMGERECVNYNHDYPTSYHIDFSQFPFQINSGFMSSSRVSENTFPADATTSFCGKNEFDQEICNVMKDGRREFKNINTLGIGNTLYSMRVELPPLRCKEQDVSFCFYSQSYYDGQVQCWHKDAQLNQAKAKIGAANPAKSVKLYSENNINGHVNGRLEVCETTYYQNCQTLPPKNFLDLTLFIENGAKSFQFQCN